MAMNPENLAERLRMLGLASDEGVPRDRVTSAVAALACFPMYMVANVHAWSDDRQFRVPLIDWPGSEAVREAYAIGQQEARLPISDAHREVLGGLLSHAKPSDRIIYEYALETLSTFLAAADPTVASTLKAAVARSIVAVAAASGKGFLGTGRKVTPDERACIDEIARRLDLASSAEAAASLRALAETV